MTLFASPFAASMAVHLVLEQQARPFTIEWLSRGPQRQIRGEAYAALNPKRRVPALLMPDGELYTEITSILYHLEPPSRAHLEWLSFLATELHQAILGPMFDPATPEAGRQDVIDRLLPPCLAVVTKRLDDAPFLVESATGAPMGADAYLYWGLMLLHTANVDGLRAPSLQAFQRRISSLDHAEQVLAVERRQFMATR